MSESGRLSAAKIREYCARILAMNLKRNEIPRTRPEDEACDLAAAESFMDDKGQGLIEVIEREGNMAAETSYEDFARKYAIPLELNHFRELLMALQPDTHEPYARTRCFITDKLTDLITVNLTYSGRGNRLTDDRRLALALVRRHFEDVRGIARTYNPYWSDVTFAEQHAGTVMFSFFVHAGDLLETGDWPYIKRETGPRTARVPGKEELH